MYILLTEPRMRERGGKGNFVFGVEPIRSDDVFLVDIFLVKTIILPRVFYFEISF